MFLKKIFLGSVFSTLVSSVVFSSGFANAAATALKVDTAATKLNWLGKKVTGQHEGAIALKSGEIMVDKDMITGGKFEIDMNSMTCTDIADPDTNGKLLGHLKSEDFFGTEKFPTATFQIKSAKALPKADANGNTHEISGDLTIKGISKPSKFPAKVELKADAVTATGTVVVDRTLYGVKYGSGKFFQNLGDKVINDNFSITLNLSAKK
jgi:polyisoprenoid-binding protein YceI